ncbi:MAG: T9SS type A sorting domain-containing protein, partial [Bacteroidales bacterium]|nr:T9SS type A sorting domain-containing protein [Bacteroidales bacterium]
YLWTEGQTTALIDSIASGDYHCVITDTNGCKINFDYTLDNPDPPIVTLSFTSPDTTCSNASAFLLTGENPTGGAWSGTGVEVDQFNPSTASIGWNIILYTYVDSNNCKSTAIDSIYVDVCSDLTKSTFPEGIKVFQNLTNNIVKITSSCNNSFPEIEIINLLGVIIYHDKMTEKNKEIDISKFENGIYFIVVRSDTKRSIFKIIKAG